MNGLSVNHQICFYHSSRLQITITFTSISQDFNYMDTDPWLSAFNLVKGPTTCLDVGNSQPNRDQPARTQAVSRDPPMAAGSCLQTLRTSLSN